MLCFGKIQPKIIHGLKNTNYLKKYTQILKFQTKSHQKMQSDSQLPGDYYQDTQKINTDFTKNTKSLEKTFKNTKNLIFFSQLILTEIIS